MFYFLLGGYPGMAFLDQVVSLFNILRNFQTFFQNSYYTLHFTSNVKQVKYFYIFVVFLFYLLCFFFFILAILVFVQRYLIVVLIFISPMLNDAVRLFMCLGHLFISFGEMSIQTLCPFLSWVIYLCFYYWVIGVLYTA